MLFRVAMTSVIASCLCLLTYAACPCTQCAPEGALQGQWIDDPVYENPSPPAGYGGGICTIPGLQFEGQSCVWTDGGGKGLFTYADCNIELNNGSYSNSSWTDLASAGCDWSLGKRWDGPDSCIPPGADFTAQLDSEGEVNVTGVASSGYFASVSVSGSAEGQADAPGGFSASLAMNGSASGTCTLGTTTGFTTAASVSNNGGGGTIGYSYGAGGTASFANFAKWNRGLQPVGCVPHGLNPVYIEGNQTAGSNSATSGTSAYLYSAIASAAVESKAKTDGSFQSFTTCVP